MNTFIFTCGDINGIGPEIVIKTLNGLQTFLNYKFIFICPVNIFLNEYKNSGADFNYSIVESLTRTEDFENQFTILDSGNIERETGIPTAISGEVSYRALKESYRLLESKVADAVITAPISKEAIKLAGVEFPGQTEMFANWCGVNNFVMMFLSKKMKTALVTIHEPIKNLPGLITKEKIINTVNTVFNTLSNDLNIKQPTMALLGLNPHAGENGNIGTEEKEFFLPALDELQHLNIHGPFVADAFFGKKMFTEFDAVIGMYHDQVLIPFKMLNFDSGVNYTAGLPIVRTSPDHGTAFDIAGKGIAKADSMLEAFKWADIIVSNRKAGNEN